MKNIAFIYLTQDSGEYYVTDDPGYNVQRRPQLGLQYLCAVLEKKNVKSQIFDQTVTAFGIDWLAEKLKEYDMAGFYCSDPQEAKVKNYAKIIKGRLDIPILVGGPSTLTNPSFLEHGCDIVVHGEGEATIQEIVEYYDGKRGIDSINGISYMNEGKIITAPERKLIENLDELPFPDRSKIDINAYHDYFLFGMKKPYMTIIASRGCAYRCHFCTSYKIWRHKYRRRSVDNVLAEIDDARGKYGIKYVAFQDDIFGMTNDWIEEFCNKLLQRSYRIRWMVILHPFSVKSDTKRVLRLMRKAGCDTLSFGIQSGHPQILKNIDRSPAEPEQLKKILKVAEGLGFVTAAAYIFGLPGDTKETARSTIDYSIGCGSTLASYYILSTLRGSEIERLYRSKKICDLSQKELEEITASASRQFYMRPSAIIKIAYFILKNPEWIIKIGLNMPSIMARIGFAKARNKMKEGRYED